MKKALSSGAILVNGNPVSWNYLLETGDTIDYIENKTSPPKPYRLDVEIVFEDDHLIAINKPSGLLVSGNQFKTAFNVLAYVFTPSTAKDALPTPLPVHRLDQATSGILLAAKTQSARIKLGEMFEDRAIQKTYLAIVIGDISASGTIELDIDGKPSFSQFKKIKSVRSLRSGHLSLIEVYPKTGRKHQIRKHLASTGHPILGDKLYCPQELLLKHKGLFLCAKELKLQHPEFQDEICLSVDSPKKYEKRLESEEKRWNRQNKSL
ncbi:MAG: RluA family pseudouridine synthase [Crocinitomicaceae bacterium]